MFSLAAVLLLVTAGVFATRKKALSQGLVVFIAGTTYEQVGDGTLGANVTTTGTAGQDQATVTDINNNPYTLYFFDGSSTYSPVYSSGW